MLARLRTAAQNCKQPSLLLDTSEMQASEDGQLSGTDVLRVQRCPTPHALHRQIQWHCENLADCIESNPLTRAPERTSQQGFSDCPAEELIKLLTSLEGRCRFRVPEGVLAPSSLTCYSRIAKGLRGGAWSAAERAAVAHFLCMHAEGSSTAHRNWSTHLGLALEVLLLLALQQHSME
jgi:hypothetical protein